MSLEVGQAQGIATVDVCGVNGLLCADIELFLVESDRFQSLLFLAMRDQTSANSYMAITEEFEAAKKRQAAHTLELHSSSSKSFGALIRF